MTPDERTDVMEETLERETEKEREGKERVFWENKFPPKTLRFSADMFRCIEIVIKFYQSKNYQYFQIYISYRKNMPLDPSI